MFGENCRQGSIENCVNHKSKLEIGSILLKPTTRMLDKSIMKVNLSIL